MRQVPPPPQMRILAELGIAHNVSRTPNGSYALAFGHVTVADGARALLTAAGYEVTAVPFNRRGMIATPPARLTLRQRHPAMIKWLKITLLVIILPSLYISVPVYSVIFVRWYRRTRGVSVWTAVRRTARKTSTARHSRPNYI
jgi:hypothetical protein